MADSQFNELVKGTKLLNGLLLINHINQKGPHLEDFAYSAEVITICIVLIMIKYLNEDSISL